MTIHLPEFILGKKTTNSTAQRVTNTIARRLPRATLALVKRTTQALDNVITIIPKTEKHSNKVATGATGVLIGAALPYVSWLDGGISLVALTAGRAAIPKLQGMLSPELRESIDKKALASLSRIHEKANKFCGKDEGAYDKRMQLFHNYSETRDRPKVIGQLNDLVNSKASRDDFFGAHDNESRVAIQVFNVLSRSQNSDIRRKSLEVLAARVADSGNPPHITEAVARYHNSRDADDFTNILVKANSLKPQTIHHMFGDNPSALIFVHNALLHDQDFTSRLITVKEGIHDGNKTVASLSIAQTKDLRSIAGREAAEVFKSSNTLEARMKRVFQDNEIKDVKSNAAETNDIPGFNYQLLQPQITGDFRFSLTDFVRAIDSGDQTKKLKAVEKLLAANSIIEHRLAQTITKEGNHTKEISKLRQQQALMLRVLRDPKIIDDTGSLQRNIDKLVKSGAAVALINQHADQVIEIHLVNQGRQAVRETIKDWNNEHPADSILIGADPLNDLYDKYTDLKTNFTNLTQAYMNSFNTQFGDAIDALVPNHHNLAQKLELISQSEHEATSPEALIARIHQNDHPQLIKTLETGNLNDKDNAFCRILIGIRDSLVDEDQREAAYSLVVEALGSKHGRVTEAEIDALTHDPDGDNFERLQTAGQDLFSVEKGYHAMEQTRENNIRPYLLELYTQTQSHNPEIEGQNTNSPTVRDEIKRKDTRKYHNVQRAFEASHGKDQPTMTRIFEELIR